MVVANTLAYHNIARILAIGGSEWLFQTPKLITMWQELLKSVKKVY